MNIQVFENYAQMSEQAADIVLTGLNKKRHLTMCTATGNSPTGMYERLAATFPQQPQLFGELSILKLDEWVGLSADDPGSCEHYLRKYLIVPLKISEDRFEGFRPLPGNANKECDRVQGLLEAAEPVDLCILGLGKNGHLGFNEPAEFLQPRCHVAELSEMSKSHGMVGDRENKPEYGMTLGMQNILSSRRIILLICGTGKEEALSMLQSGKILTQWPVTFLWLHPYVDCFVVKS